MFRLITKRLEQLYSGDFNQMIHGGTIPLISIDHLEGRERNPLLYNTSTGAIRSDFLGLVDQSLDRLVTRDRLRLSDVDNEALASLFKELFSNTHLHARTDLNGALYQRSARGILIAVRAVDKPHEGHTGSRFSIADLG